MTYYKKIQIITDNPYIAKRFEKEVLAKLDINDLELEFSCSPFSKLEGFKNLVNEISYTDLREEITVAKLIEEKDLILSIHCKQLFPKTLVNNVKCINVHPGYNPINRGWYPQVFAITENIEIGATIHEIDEELDHGKIIDRAKVEKFEYDTSLSLYNRVVDKEIELLQKNIIHILNNSYTSYFPENEGRLYLKKDFNALCELNLDEQLTMREAINKLRALSHGEYKNAFFYDKKGTKIYVAINFDYEE